GQDFVASRNERRRAPFLDAFLDFVIPIAFKRSTSDGIEPRHLPSSASSSPRPAAHRVRAIRNLATACQIYPHWHVSAWASLTAGRPIVFRDKLEGIIRLLIVRARLSVGEFHRLLYDLFVGHMIKQVTDNIQSRTSLVV